MSDTPQPWSADQKKLIFATVARGLSPADQALFEAVCLSSGLDPIRKEIYAVTRNGKNGAQMSIQTGIDGYLKLANRTNQLDGIEVLYYDKEGNESEVWLSNNPPTACLVRVYRKGASRPFVASCRFEAYTQNNQMWRKFPETMLAKACTTLALRRGFADVIGGGIASADEMDQAGLAATEALAQGTPQLQHAMQQEAPKPSSNGTKAKRPATAKTAPAAEAVKEFKGSSADIAAENLAKSLGGQVVEGPDKMEALSNGQTIVNGTPEAKLPSYEDFQAVGLEMGLTTHAIEGVTPLLNGDFTKGINLLRGKTPEQIAEINARHEPKPPKSEGDKENALKNW